MPGPGRQKQQRQAPQAETSARLLAAYGLTPAGQPAPPPSTAPVPHDHSADNPQEKFYRLIESPFADSMRALAGRPIVTAMADRGAGTLGEYVGPKEYGRPVGQDTVYLTPELMQRRLGTAPRGVPGSLNHSPEYTLAHELGHRLEATQMATGSSDMPAIQRAMRDSVNNAAWSQPGGGAPSAYWNENQHEHYAEAFANGVTFLRELAGQQATPDLATRAAGLADRFEQRVPGTRRMVQQLLTNPLYANHPLNQMRAVPVAQADATRTAAR